MKSLVCRTDKTDKTRSRALVAAVCVGLSLSGAGPLLAEPVVTGRATVIDGDTIDIGKVRIRFNGVDAPESWQRCKDADDKEYRCGALAAKALDAWLAKSRPEFKVVRNRKNAA